jgi:hypothetical protein
MKTGINLLPPSARKIKERLKLMKFLAVVQIAVFLSLFSVTVFLNISQKRVWQTSNELAGKISSLDPAPALLAEELQTARKSVLADEQNEVLAFNREWLNFILQTVPENAALNRIDYNNGTILISCVTDDLLTAELHMVNMAELFTYVWSGRITRTDGLYLYEIKARD